MLLPPFLVLECVCCFRPQIVDMIRAVTSLGCVQGETLLSGRQDGGGNPVPVYYTPTFSSVRGVYNLIAVMNIESMYPDRTTMMMSLFSSSDMSFNWHHFIPADYHRYPIQPSAAVDVCLWVFLVVPITFFTLYIYEPVWLRVFRRDRWGRFRSWLSGKDGTAATLWKIIKLNINMKIFKS